MKWHKKSVKFVFLSMKWHKKVLKFGFLDMKWDKKVLKFGFFKNETVRDSRFAILLKGEFLVINFGYPGPIESR